MISMNEKIKSYEKFKDELNINPFLIILGKYDHVLGPRALNSSFELTEGNFVRDLLRDALNTKNKYVLLDFKKFYAQVCKTEVEDPSARGGKQLYAIIILRHSDLPTIPIIHFKRIEMMFHKYGAAQILNDDENIFYQFFEEIKTTYMNKNEVVPLESLSLQVRSGITTIQGFCELILEDHDGNKISREEINSYVHMMLDSCNDITDALDKQFSGKTTDTE